MTTRTEADGGMEGEVMLVWDQIQGEKGLKLVKKKSKANIWITVELLILLREYLGGKEPQAFVWNYKVRITGLDNSLILEVLDGMKSLVI